MKLHRLILASAVLISSETGHAAVDFQKEILPIFEANCVQCHGAEKAMGKLKLDSAAGIDEKLADDDHLLVKGDPEKSELYKRLVLPADDKKRMPKGADPLDEASVDLIAAWIKEGAVFSVAATEPAVASAEPTAEPAVEAAPAKPQVESLPLPEVDAAPQEAVDRLIAAGAQVLPLYAESNLLDVSFALSPSAPTDDSLKLLADVALQVFILNLKNAQASDAGWSVLAKLTNLSALNVQGSSFSDDSAKHLSGLERLETLNLYDTRVTDAVLEPLKGLQHLRKLYLWKTQVTYDAVIALEKENPGIEWNLGWDHPVIARKRLEGQKTEFAELVKQAEAEAARLKTDLQVAEEAHKTAVERLKEVDESLAKLDGDKPADKSTESKAEDQ